MPGWMVDIKIEQQNHQKTSKIHEKSEKKNPKIQSRRKFRPKFEVGRNSAKSAIALFFPPTVHKPRPGKHSLLHGTKWAHTTSPDKFRQRFAAGLFWLFLFLQLVFGVKRRLEIILSHQASSCLIMNPNRATYFRQTSMIFKIQILQTPEIWTSTFSEICPQPSGKQNT